MFNNKQKNLRLFLISITIAFSNCQLFAIDTDTLKTDQTSVHFQATVVNQSKYGFNVLYSGNNSLSNKYENTTSITSTLFLGTRLWKNSSIFLNPEIAGGSGLSSALGIADATNGETFRVGDSAPKIYLARLFFRQLFPIGSEKTYYETDINQIGGYLPKKYFSLIVGKLGAADYFDDNKYSHDPRTQFMCWGLMDNGAWDYPANTRGYTPSITLEYVNPKNELRYSFALLPKNANGNDMDWNTYESGSHNLEFTQHYSIKKKEGTIRLLSFFNYTHMGNYSHAVKSSLGIPSIVDDRRYGRVKYGFGINIEQDLGKNIGMFLRAGWNDGKNETWAFTEIDHSLSVGLSASGKKWKRKNDNAGVAIVISGISKEHQTYLQHGGEGFILGDGNLNYKGESVTEVYYSTDLYKNQIFITGSYQLVLNPGYNADRKGPVNILSLRVHVII